MRVRLWLVLSTLGLMFPWLVLAQSPARIGDLASTFSYIVSIALAGVGLASLAMMVVSGFKFLTAGSDKEATQKAGRTFTYALAGLIVTVSAWVIINFLGKFLGIDFSVFNICLPGYSGPGCT